MPFKITLSKGDVQSALSDQGFSTTRATKLDNLDATITSRPSGADWTAARAGYLDAAISSRAAPGAAMGLASPYDARLDAAISSRASGADYNSVRAAKLDNLDAAISTRAAPGAAMALASPYDTRLDAAISSRAASGAAMDLISGAKAAIWNEAIPGTPTAGSFGERVKNNLDAAITTRAAPGAAMGLASPYDARLDAAVSSRASPTDVDTQLGNRGITSGRMGKLDLVAAQSTNFGTVASGGNSSGLTVQLDTGGAAGQARAVVEVRYSAGAAATFYAEGSDDGSTWYEGDTFSEAGAVANKLIGYLNTQRYFRFRSPTTGIDLTFEVRAIL